MNYWSTLTLAVTTHHNRVARTLIVLREWAKALAALPLKDPNIDTWKKILFAFFVMGFDDEQDNSLEDYKSAATIIRFNTSLMKSSGLEPY